MGTTLEQTLQEVSWERKYCYNCISWRWDENIIRADGSVLHTGHCGLESCHCINAVADRTIKPPPRFISMENKF